MEDWQATSEHDAIGLNPMNPEFKRIMAYFDESRIDNMVYFALLHCILSFNSFWRKTIDPSSWIRNYVEKERLDSLTENEKLIAIGCKRIKDVLLAVNPLRPVNQPQWYVKDIVRSLKLAKPLLERLETHELVDPMVNEFLTMMVVFDDLRRKCFERVLGNQWRESIKRESSC